MNQPTKQPRRPLTKQDWRAILLIYFAVVTLTMTYLLPIFDGHALGYTALNYVIGSLFDGAITTILMYYFYFRPQMRKQQGLR